MAGIYIHIPFCKQACHYCDFHFSTNRSHQGEITSALIRELSLRKEYLEGAAVHTIYFGGGTPSLLTPAELKAIFNSLRSDYPIAPNAEITVEVNPDDLNKDYLDILRETGVNRLSIGIQSFHDHTLHYLNRAHTSASAVTTFNAARSAGFSNISIDLIYAIPDQSDAEWAENLQQALALRPEHISAYSLTIEEKTVFGHRAVSGNLIPVNDDVAASQFETLMEELQRAGYDHYEISNFCLPGFYSKHNSSYWRSEKYLGIGPSAHSYDGDSRQANVSNNALYARSIMEGKIPFQLEVLTREDHINEYLLTALRTSWGCNTQELAARFGYDILAVQTEYLNHLYENGLAGLHNGCLKLTPKGKLVADKIASDLFLVRS